MAENTFTNKIWYKIVKKFNQEKLDYVLAGGAALVIHGLPRSTLGIDIYVPAKEKVLNKLFNFSGSLGMNSE